MLEAAAEIARDSEIDLESESDSCHTLATQSANFLLTELRSDKQLRRSWRDGNATNEVFLEDYAALILGLLELYQTDFDVKWFKSARELTDEMTQKFSDTPEDAEALLIRPKDTQDNATPSGNALACEALLKTTEFTGNGKYRQLAEGALELERLPDARAAGVCAPALGGRKYFG